MKAFRQLFNASNLSRAPSSVFRPKSFNGIQQRRQIWSSRSFRSEMKQPDANFTEHQWWKESVVYQVCIRMFLALRLPSCLLIWSRSTQPLSGTRMAMATAMFVA
jgi:hypothetical protein